MRKILVLYSLLLIGFTFYSYLFVDLNLMYMSKLITGFFQINPGVVSVLYIGFISFFFFFYHLFLKNTDIKLLKKIIVLSIILLFFSYPAVISYDIFNYIFTAKVVFHYQENPFIIMPIEFQNDPMLLFTHAANKLALYGPFWILLTGIPYALGLGNFIITLFSFKLFVIPFYLGISYLIFKITNNIKSVAFFALNPLVLIETFVSSHNDVVMMFFALFSVYLLKQKKLVFAILLLILSILVKYATIFLIPLFLYYAVKRIKRQQIDWNRFYFLGFILMLTIFFLSPLREEIYPWYAIWPLTFLALISQKRKMLGLFFVFFSIGLMLRYIPFMLSGTYFEFTPVIREALTIIPIAIFCFYLLVTKKLKLLFE